MAVMRGLVLLFLVISVENAAAQGPDALSGIQRLVRRQANLKAECDITPSPQSPAPSTPSPQSPKSPAPSTPSPQSPKSPAPSTPSPQSPKSPAPSTPLPQSPKSPAPSTPSPLSPAPSTPLPQSPRSPAPSTPSPFIPKSPAPSNPSPQSPATTAPLSPRSPSSLSPAPSTPSPQSPRSTAPSTTSPQNQRNLTPSPTLPPTPKSTTPPPPIIRTTPPPVKTTPVPKACPYGWTPFGAQCYMFFSQAVNWATAERNCQSNGGNLASVHSQVQNNVLISLVPGNARAWIGGHDCEVDGVWLWSDGSSYNYGNWCPGEPNNFWGRPENCLEINWTQRRCWNDETCTNRMGYICARNL